MTMNNDYTKFLDLFEMLLPVIFLVFTHFIDGQLYHDKKASLHANKSVRIIFHYQWELSFLIISLLLILAIQMLELPLEAGNHSSCSVIVAGLASLAIIALVYAAFYYASNKPRMGAFPLYLSYVVYCVYCVLFISHKIFNSDPAIVPSIAVGVACIVGFLVLYRWVEGLLFDPILDRDDPESNESVFNNPNTAAGRRMNALALIIEYHALRGPEEKLKYWVSICESEFADYKEDIIPASVMRLYNKQIQNTPPQN